MCPPGRKGEGGMMGRKKGKFILAGERERIASYFLSTHSFAKFSFVCSTEVSKKYVDIFFGTKILH